MASRVIRRLEEAIKEGTQAQEEAERIIKLGKRAGIDVTEQETRLEELTARLERIKTALKEEKE